MARKSRKNAEVIDFILKNVSEHPGDVSVMAGQKFGLSRTSISRYMQRLVEDGVLGATGNTSAKQYYLRKLVDEEFALPVDFLWTEDMIWRERIRPLIKNVPQNVIDICQYGFTEMLNNVIDHSQSPHVFISYEQTYNSIKMVVYDQGIGIFEKIKRDFKLSDPRTALLELSKGRLTSDKRRHSGEGIYFTSRMFDEFNISSGLLFFGREKRMNDAGWLIETIEKEKFFQGTYVEMSIRTNATWTTKDVFNECQGDTFRFRKTHVPIKLAQYPGEQLVSRSQAKRLLARFESFSEVFLDFDGVDQIGQPFADEIFRVFKLEHPNVVITAIRANKDVLDMINFVISSASGQ